MTEKQTAGYVQEGLLLAKGIKARGKGGSGWTTEIGRLLQPVGPVSQVAFKESLVPAEMLAPWQPWCASRGGGLWEMEGMLTLELGVEEMLLLSVSLNAPSDCSDICLQDER